MRYDTLIKTESNIISQAAWTLESKANNWRVSGGFAASQGYVGIRKGRNCGFCSTQNWYDSITW